MKKRKVYISGQISQLPREEYQARFAKAEKLLRDEGYAVTNPARLPPCRWPWLYRLMGYRLTLLYDLWHLSRCDLIYKIPGWKESHGANIESCWAYHQNICLLFTKTRERIDKKMAKFIDKAGEREAERNSKEAERKTAPTGFGWGIIACLLITLLGGCKTIKYVPVESHTTDTLYQVKVERNSIHTTDSIYIHEWASPTGDTIYINRDRWHTQWRDRWHTDTIYRSRTDTIAVPYPVEKPLTYWQRFCLDYGKVTTGATVALILLLAVWLFRRKK